MKSKLKTILYLSIGIMTLSLGGPDLFAGQFLNKVKSSFHELKGKLLGEKANTQQKGFTDKFPVELTETILSHVSTSELIELKESDGIRESEASALLSVIVKRLSPKFVSLPEVTNDDVIWVSA